MQTTKLFSKQITFVGAASNVKNLQVFDIPEVAFFGKSNVGKSSLINALCQRKALARVSKTPGCTKQINFFSIDGKFILADLPGYGYSKVSKTIANEWEKLILHYLSKRQNLIKIILLIDSRRGFQEHDLQIVDILHFYNRDFVVAFTKIDQITSELKTALIHESTSLLGHIQPKFFFTSSRIKHGTDQLCANIIGVI